MENVERVAECSLSGDRILVTGGSGFIGGSLTKTLANGDAEVYVLDRRSKNAAFHLLDLAAEVKLVREDIRSYPSVKGVVDRYGITGVFHLAAQAIVSAANQSPLPTFETNIMGTANLLEACRNSKTVEKIVVASSDKAYGIHQKLPYSEDFPLNACYPYDVSKMCADRIAYCYFKIYGLPVAITRLSNVYGGGDFNWSRIIPGTIRSVLMGENPIIRSDGSPVRDYIYIDDAVNAYLTLYEKLEEVKGEAFNFGTNSPVSVLELVKKIVKISEKSNLKPVILGEAKGEIDKQFLDSSKAKRMLGWEAKVDLDEGLKRTYHWYKENERWWK